MLEVGTKAPDFTLPDQDGEDVSLSGLAGTTVVLYFYPKAEAMGSTWSYLDITALGRQEAWEDSPDGYPQTPTYEWQNWHDEYGDAAPSAEWKQQIDRALTGSD
jgi:predicted dithiol-disulfide oxidoreductase (DUF899 family)